MVKNKKLILCLISFIIIHYLFGQQKETIETIVKSGQKFIISGFIRDENSGETLPYANIIESSGNYFTTSNQYGFYSLSMPSGKYDILIKYVGYSDEEINVDLNENKRLDVQVAIHSEELQEVVITVERNSVQNLEQRLSSMDVNTIRQLPSLGGEADVIRSLKLLPGVTSVSEVGGITVRGGAYDQNLMLLDEATVYNSEHLEGIYSTFNPSILKDVKFYKSGIPAKYGGRTSSVMDITQKDGNMKSFHANGGIGLLATNLTIEGPLVKDKSSFIIGARRSYVDMFFKYIPNENVKDVRIYFYDLNSKLNYIINKNNRVFLSCYVGNDLTGLDSYDLEYGNITTTLRYNHIFSNRLFSNTSLIYSKYKMSDGGKSNDWGWANEVGLEHYEFKNAFSFFTSKHSVEFGLKAIYYNFHPGNLKPVGDSSNTLRIKIPDEYAVEPAVYISDNFRCNSYLEIQGGLYLSEYYFLGPIDVYGYLPDVPKGPLTINDTVSYDKNQTVKSYQSIEPRLSLKIDLTKNQFIKLSYNKMSQNIQQVSNTIYPLPYNMWKAANTYIKPLTSRQYAFAYFLNLDKNKYEFSCELYFKDLNNIIEVKPGTDISLNKTIEAGLLQGVGRAYGIECMVSKTQGKTTGMVSYTWSRTEKKIDGNFREERINFGRYYPSDYDIPHKFTMTSEYKVNNRFTLTADFTYQTGRPITLPSGQYTYFYTLMPYFSDKNMQRMPDFHRFDVAAVLKNKPKSSRKWDGYWTFSIYNLYSRKNIYSMYIRRIPNTKDTEAVQLWGFSIVPSVSYNFNF